MAIFDNRKKLPGALDAIGRTVHFADSQSSMRETLRYWRERYQANPSPTNRNRLRWCAVCVRDELRAAGRAIR